MFCAVATLFWGEQPGSYPQIKKTEGQCAKTSTQALLTEGQFTIFDLDTQDVVGISSSNSVGSVFQGQIK